MSTLFQTVLAMILVAAAGLWLLLQVIKKRKKPGCAGGCGCHTATENLSAKTRSGPAK